jgi:hypothetical protein
MMNNKQALIERSGFHEVVDSEAMFLDLFATFRSNKVIP